MIIKTKVKAIHYKIEYICECGGKVEFNSTSMMFSNSLGTHYPHKCNNCSRDYNFVNECFPRIETEYV